MTPKIDYLKDDSLLNEWVNDSDFSENTIRNYLRGMKHYCVLQELTPSALIEEAEQDLQSGMLPRKYGIKRRFAQFNKEMGLKREWFQNHPKHPHYDLTTKRMLEKVERYIVLQGFGKY